MLLSALQFFSAALCSMAAAHVVGVSDGAIPIIAFLIPSLWLTLRFSSLVLLITLGTFAATLPLQPVALSVSQWIVIPLLMVAFSAHSNWRVVAVCALMAITLYVGIMVTQSAGKLEGSPLITLGQLLLVMLIWWVARGWQPSPSHHWWALGLLVPLWVAEQFDAVAIALLLTGMLAAGEQLLSKSASMINWSNLLGWSLPCVSFATLVLSPSVEIPKPVFVVWISILATAWITDYVLKSTEQASQL
ncbi:MAG: hypothetical protein ACRC0U_06555 [Vibrio sp.]